MTQDTSTQQLLQFLSPFKTVWSLNLRLALGFWCQTRSIILLRKIQRPQFI